MARYFDDYWKHNVMEWERTIYDTRHKEISFMERIAGLFRKNIMIDRRDSAVRLLADHVKGRTVVDLGCAGGYLCQELLSAGAKKVIGIDISPSAIESAKIRFRELNIPAEKYDFFAKNLNDADFSVPSCDFIVSLGVILYMRGGEIDSFFSKLKGKPIFIDYWEKGMWWDPTAIVYFIYRKLIGHPFISSFRKDEIESILRRHGYPEIRFHRSRRNRFVFACPGQVGG